MLNWIIKYFYPQYHRPKGYMSNGLLFRRYLIPQMFSQHRKVPWPVHKTSTVHAFQNIQKGKNVDPGDSPGNYIQANNGIIFGDNIELGPNVAIISSNHDFKDFNKQTKAQPIKIGSHVWIGANAVILPEVQIGDHVIIGAGSVVTKNIPSHSVAVGNPAKVIKNI